MNSHLLEKHNALLHMSGFQERTIALVHMREERKKYVITHVDVEVLYQSNVCATDTCEHVE